MLTSLSIRNVVLIDKLDLSFEGGLGVFTGETGAGKSILLDSLSLILGSRTDTGLIRHGQKQLSVTASFTLSPQSIIWDILKNQGIDVSEKTLLIRRVISIDGKSKAFINDEPVSVTFLKTIKDHLIEIHGQFATHGLLNPTTHISVLDSYGQLFPQLQACKQDFESYKEAQKQLQEAKIQLANIQTEKIFLTENIHDLENLNPQEGEEETLTEKRTLLMNSEKILSCTNTAYQLLTDDRNGIVHQLTLASKQLERASQYADKAFQEILEIVDQAQESLSDVSCQLETSIEKWGNISELPIIDERLFSLRSMARKHQTDINSLPNLLKKFKTDLSQLEKSAETLEHLKTAEAQAKVNYLKSATILSAARKKAAHNLDEQVAKELPDLKLGKAIFKTLIEPLPDSEGNENGIDMVTFLVSTNKGIPPAPLNKVASGGELSRFMLALKVNLAKADEVPTLIFDEVDGGIGGATADAVGLRLSRLAKECQVLAITHAPQVAAHGKHHWTVSKYEKENNIITQVKKLSTLERLQELARMLSGSQITQTAQTMAKELLEKSGASTNEFTK